MAWRMGFQWRPGTGQNEFTYAAALGALAKLPKQALVPYAALAEPMLQFDVSVEKSQGPPIVRRAARELLAQLPANELAKYAEAIAKYHERFGDDWAWYERFGKTPTKTGHASIGRHVRSVGWCVGRKKPGQKHLPRSPTDRPGLCGPG